MDPDLNHRWAVVTECNFWRATETGEVAENKREEVCRRFNVSEKTLTELLDTWDRERVDNLIPDLSKVPLEPYCAEEEQPPESSNQEMEQGEVIQPGTTKVEP